MDQKAFVRKISASMPHFAWFLGAGTSQSAGLPTAVDIIWDLKTRYYSSEENQKLSIQDVQNPAVREKIDGFAVSRGLPVPGSLEEYSRYFDLTFGSDLEAQRRYIKDALSDAKVSLALGHRTLAAMMAGGLTRAVFTTNFDNVIEKAMASVAGKDLAAFHLEGSKAALAALNNEEYPIYCKLHGDFRYEKLKNLTDHLKAQDAQLGTCLKAACARFGLIVAGYSGRDESIMKLLHDACEVPNAFPHGLYWLVLKGSSPSAPVKALIAAAQVRSITAEVVEIETFDSILSRIWRQQSAPDPALDAKVRRARHQKVEIPLSAAGSRAPLLRMNALPVVALPQQCLQLSFSKPKEWADLKGKVFEGGDEIALTKADAVFGWGLSSTMKDLFGSELTAVEATDITARIGALDDNLYLKSSVERIICLALKRGKPLVYRNIRGRSYLIVDGKAEDIGPLEPLHTLLGKTHGVATGLFTTPTDRYPEKEQISWAEAVEISLEQRAGNCWLLVQPSVWVWPKHGRRDAQAVLDKLRGNRFNEKADKLLSVWLRLLLPSDEKGKEILVRAFEGGTEAENPIIVFNNRTAYSKRLGQ